MVMGLGHGLKKPCKLLQWDISKGGVTVEQTTPVMITDHEITSTINLTFSNYIDFVTSINSP